MSPTAYHFPLWGWALLLFAALGVGLNKGGLTGLSILFVICFAAVLPAKASTGLVLPLLLVGDLCAITTYRRVVVWEVFWKLLPPAFAGILLGYLFMNRISDTAFRPVIGWIVLGLVAVQLARSFFGARIDHFFASHAFGLGMGVLLGFTTMIANAAGPVATLYFLSVRMAKWNLIGTSSWLFFIINLSKVPFSAGMGLINADSLRLNLLLAPLVVAGFFIGRYAAGRMPQRTFELFLLACSVAGALRLIL